MLKKIDQSFLDFMLFSNVFIAICAVAQCLVTYHLVQIAANGYVLCFVFLATLCIYNTSMILAKPKSPSISSSKRVTWIFSHYKLTLAITTISVCCLLPLSLFGLSTASKILMCVVGALAISYSIPLTTIKGKKVGLRNLPGVKLFLIAFVWAASCVMLPIVQANLTLTSQEVLLLFTKRFLFICAITIPFDIRDIYQDKYYNLKTIPVMLGEKKAWIFCQALLITYVLLLLLFIKQVDLIAIALTVSAIFTGWLIFKSTIQKNEYFYFLFLDGTMLLQYLLILVFTAIN